MLFYFIKYLSPTWYFNLSPKGNFAYFIDYSILPDTTKKLIDWDEDYSNFQISKLDAAWQAWHKGIIESNPTKSLDIHGIQPTVADNYRFLRKFFHSLWSWYILVLRLTTFHNPIEEIKGFFQSRSIKRINLYKKVYPHASEWLAFDSSLINSCPKVSIIIPTLNRYTYLKDVLNDLERQNYSFFDVIVIDQSEPFQKEFYENFQLDIKVFRQEEKALWLARNTGIKVSDAELLLLFDDDSRVGSDWICQHLKCLDYFQADISSGVSISLIGSKVPENYHFFRWSDQLDTGNALIHRRVFEKIGLFDRQFEKQRQGDGEFGLRAYLSGFKNISNSYAQRLHLKVDNGGLRQMGSWDGFRPKNILAPRPIPSVLYLYRKYFGSEIAIYSTIIGVLPSLLPYRFKRSNNLMLVGVGISVILLPLLLISVLRSWQLASKKLQQGAQIEYLNK